MRFSTILGSGFLIGVAVLFYFWGSMQQGTLRNTDMGPADQSAYMATAKKMAERGFRYMGDRNRMPVYPALMSFFYRQGMSDEEYFALGKTVGIGIGATVLAMAFFLFTYIGKPLDAVAATLVAMLTVFTYKAPYFRTEVLFYGVALLLFFLLLRLLENPSLTTAALAGIVGGVGYLTKASALPAILLAGLFLVTRTAFELWRKYRGVKQERMKDDLLLISQRRLACLSLFFFCFFLIIFPYIFQNKKHYGRYFYNVNSTFYMWYDSGKEVREGTRAHGDRNGWPDMPEEQIPSFHKYLRDHTLGDIGDRFIDGFRMLWHNVVHSFGFAEFALVYILALTGLVLQNMKQWRSLALREIHPCSACFVLAYFFAYLILYAWYMPISSGDRFILALFLPFLLLSVRGLSYAQDHNMTLNLFGRNISASAISPTILLFLTAYAVSVFPYRVASIYGGR